LKRVKRRYLAVQIDFEGALSQLDFLDAVWAAVKRLFGEFGASQTSLALIDFDEESGTSIIRVSLTTLQQVRAAIASITRISGKDAAIHVIAVSGTIKSLREKG
jgi:ribonuclease P/MRP protein subunit POP5